MSFLRETLTILAVLIVLALTAALAAPLFVDWSAHRGWIEERLSAALGGVVRVTGDIDVRLLPAPRLDVAGVSWRAADEGAASLQADNIHLEVAVAPLLQGVVRFVEARIERPRLTATLGDGGALNLPHPGEGGGVVAFERIEIRNGEITLLRAGGEVLRVEGVHIDADAASLHGPFRGSGSYALADGRMAFRFGAGVVEDDRLRVKFSSEPAPNAPQVDLDGALVAERAGDATRLRYDGVATVWSIADADGAQIPWRASGTLAADATQARFDPLEVRFGPQERQSTASGAAWFDAESRRLTIKLAAPQVDADRLLDSKEAAGEAMGRLSRVIAAALERPARARSVTLRVETSTPALQLGGDTITDAAMTLDLPRGGDDRLALSANLPGRAQISLDGNVESGAAARFAGRARASARDLPRLAEWIARADPDLAERLRGAPFRVIEASGDIELSRRSFAARNLDIRADRSTLAGSLAFASAVGGEPARLFADLNSPALDLDGVPSLRGPARALQDADLNLSLDARAIRVAGVGGAVVDAGRIRAKLTRNAGRLDLERLSVENLGGATLSATGHVDPDGAKLEARLEAQRLVELAGLVRRVAPGPLADLFNDRAVALSPARVNLSADAEAKGGSIELRNVRIEGTARGTRIAAAMRPLGDQVEAEAEISSVDTPMLLRQLGVETVPIRSAPRSRLTLRAHGDAASGYDAEGSGEIAGASVTFKGRVGEREARFGFNGRARVAAKDAAPLMQVLAIAWPDAQSSIPLDVAGDLGVDGGSISASALEGVLAGARFGGHLRFATQDGALRRTLLGALNVDRMSFDVISALALGPSAANARGAPLWSERAFAPGLADPPPADIELRAAEMNLRGLQGRDFAARVVLSNGAVALENMSMRIEDADIAGRLALRRDKTDASLAAALHLKAPLDLRDQIRGDWNMRVELAATGRSERALISSLAGGGNVRLTDIVIPGAAADAIDGVVALAEKDAIAPDERTIVAALQKAFARAPLRAGDINLDILAASGVLRFQPVKIGAPGAEASLSGAFDLRTLGAEQTLEIVSRTTPPKWTDPNPRVRMAWSGPVNKATRSIDAASLVNGLSARAIQRESARIEALEADIRERAMFNRRLRTDEWRRQREAEIRAFLLEQERLEKLRIEAERRAEAERAERERQEQLRLEAERRERERQEQLRMEAERRAQEKQRLIEQLNRPLPPPPIQLPGAVAPQ
ncbi:MAG: AsmA family protein [Beijerinckiaceae bacterium]